MAQICTVHPQHSPLHSLVGRAKCVHQARCQRRCIRVSGSMEGMLSPDENWDNFWSRYSDPQPSSVAGWVGKFVSFAPSGVGEGDIRFQDVWLRTFQERDAEGKFRMRMIRRADQATKSWPRGGRERPSDGNDETTLEGTKEDSSFPAGFWHPYGRGANVPPTRVVACSPEFLAQVTLKLPDAAEIAAAQAFDFMGGSEAQFIRGGLRWTLTATYKGEGGGSILFHQMGWDPVFLRDIDPEQPIDLAATLRTKAPGPQLPPDATGWLSGEVNGTSHSLKFLGQEQGWQRMPEQPATWTPPVPTDDQVLYCYPGGAYGLYPKTLTGGADLVFEAGVFLEPGLLWRYLAKYGADRWVDTVTWQTFHSPS